MLFDDQNIYDRNKNKLDNHYKKVLSDIPGIDAFDKIDRKYSNIITDIPKEEVFDEKENKALGLFI